VFAGANVMLHRGILLLLLSRPRALRKKLRLRVENCGAGLANP
jgi:hypothetical protein